MTAVQRAAQIWPLLSLAAANRQVLTYEIVAQAIGVPGRGLGHLLEPIQSYCLLHGLPPLTALVVGKDSGMPGTGFTAAADVPAAQASVFAFDWRTRSCPSLDEFDEAVRVRPSRGTSA